jgi:GntR family transcriptional regulator
VRTWEDTRPPYLKYAAQIRRQIMSGDFDSGESDNQLPSIKYLMEVLNTKSTSVVQRALEVLEAEGLVERQHGKGNFARRWRVVAIDAVRDPMAANMKYKLRRVEEVVPAADVRAELGIGPSDTAILREQVGRRDGEPVELVSNYYRHDVADGTRLAESGPLGGGSKAYLESMGYVEAEMIDLETFRAPEEHEVVALELPEGVPIVSVLRVIRNEHGVPVEVSVIVKGGHRYALRHRTLLR